MMAGPLQGAFVQAWVWVDLTGEAEWDDEHIRADAIHRHYREGEVEIDAEAEVSRSYEGG